MDRIDASSATELIEKLRSIDISVPRRTMGRKTEHTERYAIVNFLISRVSERQYKYPISIIHRDKPDFLLQTARNSIGIECTEAIPKQLAWAQALMAEHFPDGLYEPEFFRWNSPIRTKAEMMELLSKSQKKLHGVPVYGDGIEKDWANWMHKSICSKTEKLNSPGFEVFERNQLLIYDNLPKAWNNLNKASAILFEKLKRLWTENVLQFNRVIIETRNYYVEITPLEIELFKIEEAK